MKDLDPPAEHFEPGMLPHDRLRIYALKGRRVWLPWCRDSRNNWQTELADGMAPEPVQSALLDLTEVGTPSFRPQAQVYDPWEHQWQPVAVDNQRVPLPKFTRSLVVKLLRPAIR